MGNNPTTKSGNDEIRIDHEKKLIFIPGKDEPQELLPPIQQRHDAEGNPYQHVLSATEMIEADEIHKRCMKFVRDAMKATWKCTQCGRTWNGTELHPTVQMQELLHEMIQPGGHKVDWQSIIDHLREHLLCPSRNPEGKLNCKAPVDQVVNP